VLLLKITFLTFLQF